MAWNSNKDNSFISVFKADDWVKVKRNDGVRFGGAPFFFVGQLSLGIFQNPLGTILDFFLNLVYLINLFMIERTVPSKKSVVWNIYAVAPEFFSYYV
jgi:hypothetical protein